MLHNIWAASEPYLIEIILSLIVGVLIPAALRWAKSIGIDIEIKRRAEFDDALQRILRGAFARELSADQMVDIALAYLRSTMPATLRDMGATDAALRDRIKAEISGASAGRPDPAALGWAGVGDGCDQRRWSASMS